MFEEVAMRCETMPGAKLGRYKVLRRIPAEEQMEHYAAVDPASGVPVILRRVPLQGNAALKQECEEFARAAGRIVHRNLAYTYEHWIDGDSFWLAQEAVEGVDLETFASSLSPGEIGGLVEIFRDLSRAVAELHMNGITLGRITPEDIVVEPSGNARLVRFFRPSGDRNSARLRRRVALLSTVASIAPEERVGVPADQSTDLFMFGVLMYQTLAGSLPRSFHSYGEPGPADVLPPIERPSSLNPAIPRELDDILLDALQPERSRRTPSFWALAQRLDSVKL
jgi:serine/threonine-protein kinase